MFSVISSRLCCFSYRKPPDQKLYERDLEAALTLSLLHGTKDCHVDLSPTTSLTPTLHTEQYPPMGLSPTADLSPTAGVSVVYQRVMGWKEPGFT